MVAETIAEALSEVENLVSVDWNILRFAFFLKPFTIGGYAFYGLSFFVFHPVSVAMAIAERCLRTEAAAVYAYLHRVVLAVRACIARVELHVERACVFLCDEIDDATDGTTVVKGRRCAPYHLYSFDVIDVDSAEIDVVVGAFTTYPFAIEQEKNRLAVHALVVNAGGLAHAVVVKLYARERIFKERVQVYGVYGLYFFLRDDACNYGYVFQWLLAS